MSGDYRDRVREFGRADGLEPDEKRMVLRDTWDDPDADLVGDVPARFEVCDLCDGRGKHVNPSIDAHGLSGEDFAEDPDFAEDYFGGTYDVPCYQCGGARVVLVPDPERATKEQLAAIERRQREHYDHIAEVEAERRMGA